MTEREDVIRRIENVLQLTHKKSLTVTIPRITAEIVVSMLKEQEAKPPIHVHEEYPEHDWKTDEKGEVDDFAWGQEYCNGPFCERCYYAFCIFCEPNGWDKKPCIVDFFKCPKCGEKISKNTKFCDNCGQAVKWE